MHLKKIVFIGVLFVLLTSFTEAHKYYISLTQINYNKDSKSVEITMNLFLDDFELTLNKSFNKTFNLSFKEELENSNDYIETYLQNHFELRIDSKKQEINFLDKEYDGDVIYLNIEIENIKRINTVEVKNDVLIAVFPDQQNLIKLKINDQFDSLLLTKNNDTGSLEF